MKFSLPTLALVLVGVFGAHGANAQSALTRDQVKAELSEAIRTGNMMAAGESGLRLNELHPERYAKPAPQLGRTRAEVKAELVDAIRTGDIVAAGELGLKANEEFPQRYPAVSVAIGKTREQVRAETAEAIRTGDIVAAGDAGLKENQLFPARYSKARNLYGAQAQSAFAGAGSGTR